MNADVIGMLEYLKKHKGKNPCLVHKGYDLTYNEAITVLTNAKLNGYKEIYNIPDSFIDEFLK